jgi:hypothetical protein
LSSKGKAEDGVVFGSIQTLCILDLYSALLGVGLVPSPFFKGKARMGLFLVLFKRFVFPTFIPPCWAGNFYPDP